jgi:hypothetical protein
LLWISIGNYYNDALIVVSGPLLPSDVGLKGVGYHIVFNVPGIIPSVSINGLVLHYGLIFLVVLVLAAVGIGVSARLRWLVAMVAGAFLTHVLGIAMLAWGLDWASNGGSPGASGSLVFSLFAIFWGLLPAVAGGLWCFTYWRREILNRAIEQGLQQQSTSEALSRR